MTNPEYKIDEAVVLSNDRAVTQKKKVLYMPVYFVMFMKAREAKEMREEDLIF